MRKLHSKGFAHLEIIIMLVVVLTVGAVAGYMIKTRGHAAATGADICGASYGSTPYRSKDLYLGYSERQAVLNVYYSKNPYKMCAVLLAKNKAYGAPKFMAVRVDWTTMSGGPYTKKDAGTYKYYAGPLYVDQTNIRSMTAKGTMSFGGKTESKTVIVK
jgi:hypothetical protein